MNRKLRESSIKKEKILKTATVLELILAAVFVLLDLFIPTLVILVLMAASMLLRKGKISEIGLKKAKKPIRLILFVFVLSVIWTLVDIGLVLPGLNHLTGTTQDLSTYENLKGNIGQLTFLLAASWTLAAFGEEIVYRGYLQNRIRSLFAGKTMGVLIGIVLTSVLFGFAHTEQGVIGIAVTMIDAVFFSLVRLRFKDNLWAPILAHGYCNSIGIVCFFFTGPIYGLW